MSWRHWSISDKHKSKCLYSPKSYFQLIYETWSSHIPLQNTIKFSKEATIFTEGRWRSCWFSAWFPGSCCGHIFLGNAQNTFLPQHNSPKLLQLCFAWSPWFNKAKRKIVSQAKVITSVYQNAYNLLSPLYEANKTTGSNK